MNDEQTYRRQTLQYTGGAFGAAVVTGCVYIAAVDQWFDSAIGLALFSLVLAAVQLMIQLITFLHLGEETSPRWKTYSFLFAFLMALVIIVGSIWIMMNLDYNMRMTPQQMDSYMLHQNKKGF